MWKCNDQLYLFQWFIYLGAPRHLSMIQISLETSWNWAPCLDIGTGLPKVQKQHASPTSQWQWEAGCVFFRAPLSPKLVARRPRHRALTGPTKLVWVNQQIFRKWWQSMGFQFWGTLFTQTQTSRMLYDLFGNDMLSTLDALDSRSQGKKTTKH